MLIRLDLLLTTSLVALVAGTPGVASEPPTTAVQGAIEPARQPVIARRPLRRATIQQTQAVFPNAHVSSGPRMPQPTASSPAGSASGVTAAGQLPSPHPDGPTQAGLRLEADRSVTPLADFDLSGVFQPLNELKGTFQPVSEPGLTDRDPYTGTNSTTSYCWTPRNLAHRTLYFEDLPLERYGYSRHPAIQPAVSTVQFWGDFLLLPFRWAKEERCGLHYTLGLTRAGTDAPRVQERPCRQP